MGPAVPEREQSNRKNSQKNISMFFVLFSFPYVYDGFRVGR